MKSFKDMVTERDALRKKLAECGKLPLDEEIQLDYLEQKIDDLNSDIEFSY